MSKELESYMYTKLSQLKDFYVPKTILDQAKLKMLSCTNEIQIDNIAITILRNY